MVGFLIRRLPFWIREPLLILIGSVFGVRIMYLAAVEQNLGAAGIGAVFLLVAAVSVYRVVRAVRARRNPSPVIPEAGTAVGAAAQVQAPVQVEAPAPAPAPAAVQAPAPVPVPASPAPAPRAPEKEPNQWGQAFAAVAVFGALAAVLWLAPQVLPSDTASNSTEPASCSDGEGEHEKLPQVYKKAPRAATGEELCEALNRPDLATLLGTPEETAISASGSNNTAPLTDEKVAAPDGKVAFETYTVQLLATYNRMTIDQYVMLMKYGSEQNVEHLTVLGRPAVLSSDYTMKIEINLGAGGSSGGPVENGPLARTLTVALDRADRGGYYDLTVWSDTGALPDDSALRAIAEKVLPTLPERPVR